jgi:hypothetical protein
MAHSDWIDDDRCNLVVARSISIVVESFSFVVESFSFVVESSPLVIGSRLEAPSFSLVVGGWFGGSSLSVIRR